MYRESQFSSFLSTNRFYAVTYDIDRFNSSNEIPSGLIHIWQDSNLAGFGFDGIQIGLHSLLTGFKSGGIRI